MEGCEGLENAPGKHPRSSGTEMRMLTYLFLQWLKEGKIRSIEHVTEGIENAAEAFVATLQSNAAVGKAILKVADPE